MWCATKEEYHTLNGHREGHTLQRRLRLESVAQAGGCGRAEPEQQPEASEGGIPAPAGALRPVPGVSLTLPERFGQSREENSNHSGERLGNVSCVQGWNSLFELEKKTQCKDSATAFECINTFAKMAVNTCPLTTNDGTESNLLKCN